MKLSKIVKKITSISLAAALAVSGINYQSAKAEAAELPVVTVLGATLSLENNVAGTQSMRVAIKVENADNASACGMSITYNGKKLDFSTDDGVNNKLYDADADTNTIVYAVKIANIPLRNFKDNFTIEGYATPITGGTGEDVTTEAPVDKSVDGVVESIASNDPGVSISKVTGNLMRKVIGLEVGKDTEIYERDGDSLKKISYWCTSDGESKNPADAAYEYDEKNECFKITTDSASGKGIGYQCAGGEAGEYIYSMDIKTDDTVKTKVVGYFDQYSNTGNTEWTGNGEWMSVEQTITLNDYGAAYLSTNSGAKEIYIKKFEVYKPITAYEFGDIKLIKNIDVKLCEATASDAGGVYYSINPNNHQYNGDGSVSFDLYNSSNLNDNCVTAFYFLEDKAGVDVDNYSKIEMIVSSSVDNIPLDCSVLMDSKLHAEKEKVFDNDVIGNVGTEETKITIDLSSVDNTKVAYGVKMQYMQWKTGGNKQPTITVKSIKLIK